MSANAPKLFSPCPLFSFEPDEDAGESFSQAVPVDEYPSAELAWYRYYCVGRDHENYLAQDDKNEVATLSFVRPAENEGHLWRAILTTSSGGVERKAFEMPDDKQVTPAKVIDLAFPRHRRLRKRFHRVNDLAFVKDLITLDELELPFLYKFGVLYAKEGQKTEQEMLGNKDGSPAFEEFLDLLGERVQLQGFKHFAGGLDTKENLEGTHSVYRKSSEYEYMFHVSTLLPHDPKDAQQLQRKRHLGNDICMIIFMDGATPYDPLTMTSHFTHVIAVVQPGTHKGQYRIAVARKEGVPLFGPQIMPSEYDADPLFAHMLVIKMMNAECAALRHARVFVDKAKRTRGAIMAGFIGKYLNDVAPASGFSKFSDKFEERAGQLVNLLTRHTPETTSTPALPTLSSHPHQRTVNPVVLLPSVRADITCLGVLESAHVVPGSHGTTLLSAAAPRHFLIGTDAGLLLFRDGDFRPLLLFSGVRVHAVLVLGYYGYVLLVAGEQRELCFASIASIITPREEVDVTWMGAGRGCYYLAAVSQRDKAFSTIAIGRGPHSKHVDIFRVVQNQPGDDRSSPTPTSSAPPTDRTRSSSPSGGAMGGGPSVRLELWLATTLPHSRTVTGLKCFDAILYAVTKESFYMMDLQHSETCWMPFGEAAERTGECRDLFVCEGELLLCFQRCVLVQMLKDVLKDIDRRRAKGDGKPDKKDSYTAEEGLWTHEPTGFALCPPFILSLSGPVVAVHSVVRGSYLEAVTVPSLTLLTSTHRAAYALSPMPPRDFEKARRGKDGLELVPRCMLYEIQSLHADAWTEASKRASQPQQQRRTLSDILRKSKSLRDVLTNIDTGKNPHAAAPPALTLSAIPDADEISVTSPSRTPERARSGSSSSGARARGASPGDASNDRGLSPSNERDRALSPPTLDSPVGRKEMPVASPPRVLSPPRLDDSAPEGKRLRRHRSEQSNLGSDNGRGATPPHTVEARDSPTDGRKKRRIVSVSVSAIPPLPVELAPRDVGSPVHSPQYPPANAGPSPAPAGAPGEHEERRKRVRVVSRRVRSGVDDDATAMPVPLTRAPSDPSSVFSSQGSQASVAGASIAVRKDERDRTADRRSRDDLLTLDSIPQMAEKPPLRREGSGRSHRTSPDSRVPDARVPDARLTEVAANPLRREGSAGRLLRMHQEGGASGGTRSARDGERRVVADAGVTDASATWPVPDGGPTPSALALQRAGTHRVLVKKKVRRRVLPEETRAPAAAAKRKDSTGSSELSD